MLSASTPLTNPHSPIVRITPTNPSHPWYFIPSAASPLKPLLEQAIKTGQAEVECSFFEWYRGRKIFENYAHEMLAGVTRERWNEMEQVWEQREEQWDLVELWWGRELAGKYWLGMSSTLRTGKPSNRPVQPATIRPATDAPLFAANGSQVKPSAHSAIP